MRVLTFFTAVIVALVLHGGAVLAQQDILPSANNQASAQTTIDSQMKAFRSRLHGQAFGFAAPELQKLFGSTSRFIGMVQRGYGAIYDAKGWSFGRARMKDGNLYQELLVTGPDGREWVALYTLKQQPDGSWKIAGVQMIPSAGRST